MTKIVGWQNGQPSGLGAGFWYSRRAARGVQRYGPFFLGGGFPVVLSVSNH